MRIRLVHTIALWMLLGVGATVLAMGGVMAWNLGEGFSSYLRYRDAERLDTFTQVVSDAVREAGSLEGLGRGPDTMRTLLAELARRQGVSGFPGRDQSLAGRPGPPGPQGHPRPIDRPDPFGARVALYYPDGSIFMGPHGPAPTNSIERPVTVDGVIVAMARLRVVDAVPTEQDTRFLRSQYLGIVVVAVSMIAFALLLAWWLARQWVRPLLAVQAATGAIARGDLGVRLLKSRNDEIGDVMANVNLMAESLQRMEIARRRWIADISHELRTPLAGLRGEIEALVDGVRPMTAERMVSLREDALRLQALVDDLHLLALSDLGSLPCRFADTDAAEIMQSALRRFEARAAASNLQLAWAVSPPTALPVCWDRARIEQLLENLLENSLRYTDAPGRMALTLQQVGNTVTISIADTAPAVSADDLTRLFEPLYRADLARSRHTGGSGLGLAICEAIVRAHGGTIEAQASPLGGLLIVVTLPVEGRSTGA